ncbi:MAG: glucose 1-dehydrogenase [Deltaproteobacteria bacterium]|nr:glucose 1-dehydrogenase [Deltaproteobacteria bacterium]
MQPTKSLENKTAIVSGASRGIGAAIAQGLAAHGANVVLASRKLDGLKQVEAAISQAGGTALAHACHMGKADEIDGLVAAAYERFGAVDIVVNNAATNPFFGPLMQADWGVWDKTFEVNLKGPFALSRAVAKRLIDQKKPGSIINLASIAGGRAAPMQGIYGMTKAAILSMTQTMAVELGGAQIRVNALAPGLVETRFSAGLIANAEIKKMVLDRTALGRLGQPEDVVGACVFLASDASAYITGQTITIDGGWSAS